MVRDVLISGLQSPHEVHQVRNIELTATYEAVLRQNIRQYSRKLMAICEIPKLENIEVVAVDLAKFLLRFIRQLEHPSDYMRGKTCAQLREYSL